MPSKSHKPRKPRKMSELHYLRERVEFLEKQLQRGGPQGSAKAQGPAYSPKPSRLPQSCEVVLCENLETGMIEVKPGPKCPVGFIERAKHAIVDKGLMFHIFKDESAHED